MKEQTNRTEYTYGSLSGKQLAENPFTQFSNWFHEASEAKADDMGAMCLSTVSETGIPDSRIVLMKEFNERVLPFTPTTIVKRVLTFILIQMLRLFFTGPGFKGRCASPELLKRLAQPSLMHISVRGHRQAKSEPSHLPKVNH